MKDKRFYSFMVVVYPDDQNFNIQLENLTKYDYIYIKHDNDLKEDSTELKKVHYHVIVKFKNARTITALAKECYLLENMIEPIKNLNASLKYLIHYKNENKYQYDVENVFSNCNLLDKLKKLIYEDVSESEKALNLFNYICDFNGLLRFEQFFFYVCKTDQYSIYRRDSGTFRYLLELHNAEFTQKGYI